MTIFGKNGYSSAQANSLRLFAPNYIKKVDADSIKNYDFDSTSSFRTNPEGIGLMSTQQLNIDWTDFSQHTFFNSAQVKTNVAFDKILNEYPFNGSLKDTNIFLDQLTGFEKHVYDNYPKNTGYLFFSGTKAAEGSGGTYVTVKDIAGAAYPGMSSNRSGVSALNPGWNSMTVEMQLFVPTIANLNQTIIDKHSGTTSLDTTGYYLALNANVSTTTCNTTFYILSGTQNLSLNVPLTKGQWNHLVYVWDRTPGINKIHAYVNEQLVISTPAAMEFNFISSETADLLIGSGSNITTMFVPQTTFSGAIDELRIWNTVRSTNNLTQYAKKNVFEENNLLLYYRFNESGNVASDVVIDYSNNSLHGRLSSTGYVLGVRNIATGSIAGSSPMTYERPFFNPVLFPEASDVLSLRTTMLSQSAIFDEQNPNIITKLVPKHYLDQSIENDSLNAEVGSVIDNLQTGNEPRSTTFAATQTMLLLMFTWAKYFDELKLYTQEFSNLNWVDYDPINNTPDNFLQNLARQSGVDLPYLFQDASLEQYFDGENIEGNISNSAETLKYVQNQIWRRILINMQDILRSKGTNYSIKAYLRSVGIDPDNNFRIREYGGPTSRNLTWVRDNRSTAATFIDFVSGGLIRSNYLSASSRTEPGWPYRDGTSNDYLMSSGSWTYEGLYRLNPVSPKLSQSLMRMFVSGVNLGAGIDQYLYANLIYNQEDKKLQFAYRPDFTTGRSPLIMSMTGINLNDGDPWYISVGKIRNDDDTAELNSIVSSSFYLRAAKNINGEIYESYTTSSWFQPESPLNLEQYVISNAFPAISTSAPFITVGSQSIQAGALGNFLNDTISIPSSLRVTDFDGKISQIRYWSKYLNDTEWREHVRNYQSVGVDNPKTNWNFDKISSGSWNRLRLEAEVDQVLETTDAGGGLKLVDFSQNNMYFTGSAFPVTSSTVFSSHIMYYSYLSPKFDEGSTSEKVRVRSYEDYSNLVNADAWIGAAPVYEIPQAERPFDSTKFTIDFSIMDFLNQDIMTILSSLEEFDDALGSPELLFSPVYVDLEVLKKNYFNKLTDKVNLKGFFEFYKWFDTNIGTFVGQLLPYKTKFGGTNFIIENNVLCRPKVQYHSDDIYLGETNRNGLKATILVQLISGFVNRY